MRIELALINQSRWSLDFAAGTHYTNVYEQLTLDPNRVAIIRRANIVDDIAEDLRRRLDQDISKSEFVEVSQEYHRGTYCEPDRQRVRSLGRTNQAFRSARWAGAFARKSLRL